MLERYIHSQAVLQQTTLIPSKKLSQYLNHLEKKRLFKPNDTSLFKCCFTLCLLAQGIQCHGKADKRRY